MRVVLHAHSTWSYDGRWELEQLARLYGALGVRAVLMTEHDTGFAPESFDAYRAACTAASTARCTLVPGIEYSSPDNDIHILTCGLPHFLAEHRPVTETLERVSEVGGAAIFAHPIRRAAWRQFDLSWVPHLSGIELWNRKSDGVTWGREAQALIADTGLPATVGQDFHHIRHLYPLTMVLPAPQQGETTEQLMLRGLRCGTARPQAFRKPLLDSQGMPKGKMHDGLERSRVRLRDLVRKNRR